MDPMPELTITSPYVHYRVDSNTFTMGNPMPESTLTLCLSQLFPPVRSLNLASALPILSMHLVHGSDHRLGGYARKETNRYLTLIYSRKQTRYSYTLHSIFLQTFFHNDVYYARLSILAQSMTFLPIQLPVLKSTVK
jgi:hypothetical protein